MDFWSRLIGGSQAQRRAARTADPQRRLALFKRVYALILQTWQKTKSLPTNDMAIDAIRMYLEQIANILNDEARAPAPHLALAFAASQKIYISVSRIAATSYNETLIKRAVAVLSALVESEEEDFLSHAHFSESVTRLVDRVLSSGSIAVGEDTLSEIVELLFGIVAKIRLQPGLLPVWFNPHKPSGFDGAITPTKAGFAGDTHKEDFPLCYHLIDHVHHEGRIGDFARTGLLYIFEAASKSEALEDWLVGSDIPTLMATGLGALYSQLSRKLWIVHPRAELPIVLQLSDYPSARVPAGTESLFDPDFQIQFDTFLSHLAFWQDVLEHCKSPDVRQTLLDHFQILFLQQLLYPSLLESSDVDGGSAVAVLTYLRRILDALDHPELVHMILEYLLALSGPVKPKQPSPTPQSPTQVKRRMSLALLNQIEQEEERLDPSLFSLADLITSSTSSQNTQTVIAALKLVTVILAKNHIYAVGTLVRTTPSRNPSRRTHGALEAETDQYLAIAEHIGNDADLDHAYENHLKDIQTLVETHPCSAKQLALDELGLPVPYKTGGMDLICMRPVDAHYLNPDDSLLNNLLSLLDTFLTNNVETNLGLTETIITLGSCSHVRLEGWMAVDPSGYIPSGEDADADSDSAESLPDEIRNVYQARRRPTWPAHGTPRILRSLEDISAQLGTLRTMFPGLDQLVNSRKQAFRVHEEINAAVQSPALYNSLNRNLPHLPSDAPSQSPHRPSISSVPSHMRDSRTGSPSGASSPRASIDASRKPLPPPRHPSQSPAPRSSTSSTLLGSPTPSDTMGARGLSPARPSGASTIRISTDVASRPILNDIVQTADSESLKRKIQFPLKSPDATAGAEVGATPAGEQNGDDGEGERIVEVTLSHVLTNVAILQEFVLELAALMQVRASLFQEVHFA